MNKKNSIIFLSSFLGLILVFIGVFSIWIKKDSQKRDIEAELAQWDKKMASSKSGNAGVPSPAADATSVPTNAASQQAASQQKVLGQDQAPSLPSAEENVSDEGGKKEEETKKTYTSDKLKVSFDYEGELKIAEESNLINISSAGKNWKMKFYGNKKRESFEEWYKGYFEKKDNDNCVFNSGEISAGSLESKSVKEGAGTGDCRSGGNFAVSSDQSRVIRIDEGTEGKENINKVLSDFKFL